MTRLSDNQLKDEINNFLPLYRGAEEIINSLNTSHAVLSTHLPPLAIDEIKNRLQEKPFDSLTVTGGFDYLNDILAHLKNTDISQLTLEQYSLSEKNIRDIEKSKITSLSLQRGTTLADSAACSAFSSLMAQHRMQSLKMDLNNLASLEFIKKFPGNPLEELEMKGLRAFPQYPLKQNNVLPSLPLKSLKLDASVGLFDLENKDRILPLTLESLHILDSGYSPDAAERLGQEIIRLPKLQEFVIASMTPEMEDLIPFIGKTSLVSLTMPDLDFAPGSAEALANSMENKSCRITKFKGIESTEGEKDRFLNILALHEKAEEARQSLRHAKNDTLTGILEKDGTTVHTLKEQNLLFFAVKENRFGEVANLMQKTGVFLSHQEYAGTDEKGLTLTDHLISTRQIQDVFKTPLWPNAKELQQVWEALPESQQKQMEASRPPFSFRQLKNDVMKNIIQQKFKNGTGRS